MSRHEETARVIATLEDLPGRVVFSEAAVERGAQVLLDAFYDDKTLKVDDEDRAIVRAVLAAAVKEEQ